ncbi:MAG: DUF1800 family protein [Actinobacteria bacterium]|nr:MAG: DUF1800 family protein [Actinomycetota bacterium]
MSGVADRVIVHVWSEFGRRADENGSAGTDHGAAGVGFLVGTRARGKMIGKYPGLRNFRAAADYRGPLLRTGMTVPVFRGRFGAAEADRLLWRAGSGPRRARRRRSRDRPPRRRPVARRAACLGADRARAAPRLRLPARAAGCLRHDHLWWLDRTVRGNQPLVERMTLVWHDWFATSLQGVKSQQLMLGHVPHRRAGDVAALFQTDVPGDVPAVSQTGAPSRSRSGTTS